MHVFSADSVGRALTPALYRASVPITTSIEDGAMKSFDCGQYVIWGLIAALVAWTIFVATLIYAALFVPDVPAQANQLFTQRNGVQAGGFIAGWWLAIGGLAACVFGYFKEFNGLKCLLG